MTLHDPASVTVSKHSNLYDCT